MNSFLSVRVYSRLEACVSTLANTLAIFSGVLLIASVLLTCVSIVGRSLTSFGLSAVPGDYELVEIFCGLAVFAFMPYCQFCKGHICVDLVVERLGRRAVAWTQLLGDVVITGLVIVMAWRHFAGVVDKYSYGETSFILEIPLWWPYAFAMVLLVFFGITSLFTVFRDVRDLIYGIGDHQAEVEGDH